MTEQTNPRHAPQRLTGVKGMNDILPDESFEWEWLEVTVRDLMARYSYRNIRTPILEHTQLFVRGIGEVTDIVEKEMYSFEDRLNGEALTLRPENTASVVRAAIEHSLLHEGGRRLYYMGPMFRHERPQRGRYRQFHQIGAEVLGLPGPEVDAELILLASDLWTKLGLTEIRLELNSLGQAVERAAHRRALISFLEQHRDYLDADALRRLYTNPLRILDSKNPELTPILASAPRLFDFLSPESRAHFDGLAAILNSNGIEYTVNHRLVRGLDYYNLTVFEFVTDRLGSQGTVCAGGRYDDLFAQIGGKPAPAVGWALGIERILALMGEQGATVTAPKPDVYAIVPDASNYPLAFRIIQRLRECGVRIQMHASTANGHGSMKSQFKKADASGAAYAVIFGPDELSQGAVAVKCLRDGTGSQFIRNLDRLSEWGPTLQSPS